MKKKHTPKRAKAKAAAEIYTHINVVLDRSGSMASIRDDIMNGFNTFLKDQQALPGKATMTLVQFDNEIDRLASCKDLKSVGPLTHETYVPRGGTRLYDAIGLTVNDSGPTDADKVLTVILTDGLENASMEYTTESIKALLEEKQKAGWVFTFIGANQDAILTGSGIGLRNSSQNISYAASPIGTQNVMRSLSQATASFRASGQAVYAYCQEDRDAQDLNPATTAASTGKAVFAEHGSAAGKLGGPARAASLSPKRRSDIAREGGKAKWSKKSV